jgi:hypothetical protein
MLGGDNPYRVKKIVKTLDDSWSGVVHGNYQSVMEMYGGDSLEDSRFRMEGMPTRRTVYRHFIGLLVHNALNEFSKVAFNLGLNELANELRELRKEFEKSPSYTSR